MGFSDWLFAQAGRTDSIALVRLAEYLFRYLTVELGLEPGSVGKTLQRDWERGGRREQPAFLTPYQTPSSQATPTSAAAASRLPKRQARHLGKNSD